MWKQLNIRRLDILFLNSKLNTLKNKNIQMDNLPTTDDETISLIVKNTNS